jgi:Flp pilus assembly protein TadD
MKLITINMAFWLAVAGLGVTGCASAPRPADTIAEQDLRDADLDVIFATEFPVGSKAEALVRAEAAMASGDVERALFFYVKALKFDATDTDLFVKIGRIHEYRDNAELAVRAYSMALRVNPDLVAALEARGLLCLEHDEPLYAEADLRRAVALDPTAWRAWNGLGLLADGNGDHAGAIVQYTAALELQPGLPALLNNRGYSRMLAGDLPGALTDLEQSAAQDYDKAWVNLGVLYAKVQRYDDAVEALAKVLAEPEALNRTGAAAMDNRDFELARALFERAIERSPVWFPAAEENLELLADAATAELQ